MKSWCRAPGRWEYLSLVILTLMMIIFGVNYYIFNSNIEKKYVVGIVNPNPGMKSTTSGFVKGMEDNGYIEKDNVIYIRHETVDGVEESLASMIESKVDLIFSVTTPATKKAKDATAPNGIPIVFTVHDPVSSGLIKSLVHPSGNLTGIQLRGSLAKAVEWLLVIDPHIKNIYVPIKYDTKAARQSLDDLKTITHRLGIQLHVREVSSEADLEQALATLPDDVDAIFILHSILIFSNVQKIVDASIDAGIPTGSGSTLYEKGVMVTFGSTGYQGGGQASRLANRLLQGKSAANTPAEVGEFFLGVNLKTANQAGVVIPKEVLLRADFVVR
ncbi:MAG: ABC transporter substrate-binding protein [Desulfobulbaceae bacterium]|nr:ABC transporter substrate-binding protein [Desulfobulbaceae bacterium]